jgi:hypothetical protein
LVESSPELHDSSAYFYAVFLIDSLQYLHTFYASFFLIRTLGGGVQLGPLGKSATNWPIVPAPSAYEDGEFGGMMIGRVN